MFCFKKECIICYTESGKTEIEIFEEQFGHICSMYYPLVQLKNVYDCNCKELVHNKCLINIKKCPTCRKYSDKPNLYVKSFYDIIFYFYFQWLKKDIRRIEQIKYITFISVLLIFFILWLLNENLIIIDKNSKTNLFLPIIVMILYFLATYSVILNDYFKKYWLYNNGKCYANI